VKALFLDHHDEVLAHEIGANGATVYHAFT
jgi:hypothetical protein